MKKAILFCLLLLSVFYSSACVPAITKTSIRYTLKEVEEPSNLKEQFGESKIVVVNQEAGETEVTQAGGFSKEWKNEAKYVYENAIFKMKWIYDGIWFYFEFENKTEKTIKIVWDDSVYVGPDNFSSGIVKGDTKYSEMEQSQLPSSVMKKSSFFTPLYPKKYIGMQYNYYPGALGGMSSQRQWTVKPLPIIADKDYRFQIALEYEGVVQPYIFVFQIDQKTIEENKEKEEKVDKAAEEIKF
ncbi:MAG TPA: hypothetical protein DHW82_06625 [Spirochaetia bacterium]|nr:MAG: hypothetical protein A2Y41_11190 [Spirochaetes bacterium GWB1_36_13]HCL56668.1 hypothetical protein [Spirochaetia bacterium]